MAFLFVKVYLLAAFIKTVLLGLLLYHDVYDDPWVWYIAFQTVSSVALVAYRDTHLGTARTELLNAISPTIYVMRTLSIWGTGLTWYYYHERSATFAFLFIIVLLCEIGISIAAGISTQSYTQGETVRAVRTMAKGAFW